MQAMHLEGLIAASTDNTELLNAAHSHSNKSNPRKQSSLELPFEEHGTDAS
jgi:hypothetical protein